MNNFEQFLQDLREGLVAIDYLRFFLHLLVTAVLAWVLALFYNRYGGGLGNRARFSRNFLPLALTTMLIIFTVKSSIALSLGLVGALSIVRFRAAIKDPEELIYLFLSIAIGLASGAGHILLAVLATAFILAILLGQAWYRGRLKQHSREAMILNLSTTEKNMEAISAVLTAIFPYVELKRADDLGPRLEMSYLVEAEGLAQLEEARKQLMARPGDMRLSILEHRPLPA